MASWIARTSAAFAVTVFTLSACSSPVPAPTQAPVPTTRVPPHTPSNTADAQVVPEILRFTAPQLGGGTIDGADHAGDDVAMWFWAPW